MPVGFFLVALKSPSAIAKLRQALLSATPCPSGAPTKRSPFLIVPPTFTGTRPFKAIGINKYR